MIESLVVIVAVNLAAMYLVRRALRSLRGRCASGCGTASKPCPATKGMAEGIERAVGTLPRG